LEAYWPSIDPLDGDGQFCDQGDSYRPAIFYGNDSQRMAAETSKELVAEAHGLNGIGVAIEELNSFYPAEDYHQDYYEKNPIRYNYYRWGCGRDARLEEVWGDTKRLSLFD
jgi:peptide-methionine (S)-S-oxide reductase